MLWPVSRELTGRLQVSSSAACPNWRGRAPTAINANSSGESTGVSGPWRQRTQTRRRQRSQHNRAHRAGGGRLGAGSRDSLSNEISLWRQVRPSVDRRDGLLCGRLLHRDIHDGAGRWWDFGSRRYHVARRCQRAGVHARRTGRVVDPLLPIRAAPRAAHRCRHRGGRRLGVFRRRVRDGFRQGRVIGGRLHDHIAVCRGLAVRLRRRVRATGGHRHPRWHLPHRRAPRRRGARLRGVHRTRPRRGGALRREPAAVDVPAVSAVVPVVVEVPWDSEVPLVPVAPAARGPGSRRR